MTKIFKYKLPMEVRDGCVGWGPEVAIDLPAGARILTAQAQDNAPVIWAEVDPERPLERRRLFILNTGGEVIPSAPYYIGTVQINSGMFIFHIYSEIP